MNREGQHAYAKPMLVLRDVSKKFGGITAAQSINLTLPSGTVTCLVGPNGAGKTTLFNLITGNLSKDEGQVLFDGRALADVTPAGAARQGIARSFQHLRLFGEMTVAENVLSAMERSAWGVFESREGKRARLARVDAILGKTGLDRVRDVRAFELGYGEQKFLSLARIMAMDARLWLLDEPASGMDRQSYARFFDVLREQVAAGTTMCIIEHNLDVVRAMADRIAFLDQGTVLAEGEPNEVLSDPRLAAIYFGDRR